MADKPKRPKPAATKRRGVVSDDETALFLSAMKDAAPLRGRADRARGAKPRSEGGPTEEWAKPPPTPPVRPAPEKPAGPRTDLPDLAPGAPAGLDARTMDRLKRGRIRPEGVLDLHGLTRDAAHGALSGFLSRSQAAGKRCVIVVTGKGRVSEGGGVIRTEFPSWLNLPANREKVLGFAQAQPRDGGAGAFYVLLRRRRAQSTE